MTALPEDRHGEAAAFLKEIDADWARAIELVGPCRLEAKTAREPYEALSRAIAYQQLTVKAGDTMIARLCALYPDGIFPTPDQLAATEFEKLRGCGFSGRKVETLKGIAAATLTGIIPSRVDAVGMDDEELIARLVSLSGVGRWTVEMLLMFCLERQDILPVDDFGVREGYRALKSLDVQPKPKALREIGAAWAPFRSVASWYLWRIPRTRGTVMS